MTALLLRMFKGSSTVLYIGKIQIKFHPSSKKSLVLCPNKALKKKIHFLASPYSNSHG